VTPHPLYLNGRFVVREPSFPVRDPADGTVFARMSAADAGVTAAALADAEAAFAGWRRVPARARGDVLLALAAEVTRRAEEIATGITRENGKPLGEARAEVALGIDHLRWFAEEARRGYGRVLPPQEADRRQLVLRVPIGVVGAISPWNFPFHLAARKVAPALAAGCPIVLKPASATPLSAVRLAECAHAAGVPPGVFQVVAGPAEAIAGEFLANPRCRKVTFTGSTEVGRRLVAGAAAGLKPLALELGGHSPLLVFDDADLPGAVAGALTAKFRNGGQSCIAANRIYVQRGVWERFLADFTAAVRALRVGPGLDPATDIGPLVHPAAAELAAAHVADARARGAELRCGGERLPGGGGSYFAPTVLTGVPPDALGMREETFGPVAYVNPFDTEEEAVAAANATPYGLAAYAFTRDLSRALRLGEALEAGMIAVNHGLPTASNAPFGGVKQSGWGRELGSEGLEAFLEPRHVSLGFAAG
jgi:succinate-semialdehyde dehydrogenase/glutarate-semialdehyde dehydrogenase